MWSSPITTPEARWWRGGRIQKWGEILGFGRIYVIFVKVEIH